jgi:hypothetical protein
LQTNHDSSHIFVNYIRQGQIPKDPGTTFSDQNIIDAIHECEIFASEWAASDSLVNLLGMIKNRLYVIFHSVHDEALVYRVFEVLNSRGLDVSWFDKLKSQLMATVFEMAEPDTRAETIGELHRIWKSIYHSIGKRKALTSETVRFAGTLRAAPKLKQPLKRPLSEEKAVETLVSQCGTSREVIECDYWIKRVVDAEERLWSDRRRYAVTRILQARLVAIAILLREFNAVQERELLERWEKVTFKIYGLADNDARTKVGEYVSLAWKIINEDIGSDEISKQLTSIGDDLPITVAAQSLENRNCYERWSEELRYFLYCYDEEQAKKAGHAINEQCWKKIWSGAPAESIEHISPQASGLRFIHRLGNLIMLPPGVNSRLKAKEPKHKAESYETSGLYSTILIGRQIAQNEIWNETSVRKRESELIAWAIEYWK